VTGRGFIIGLGTFSPLKRRLLADRILVVGGVCNSPAVFSRLALLSTVVG
jgi:hypothetical protein